MAFDPQAFAASRAGKWIDLDGFPSSQPYQCHDVWLDQLVTMGGKQSDGHAPGNGDTVNLFYEFGKHRPGLTELFRKVDGAAGIQAGDVLFWRRGVWYPGSHVAMATGPASGELVPTLTQNPGKAKLANLITRDLVGYLRPLELDNTTTIQKAIQGGLMFRLRLQKKHTYLVLPNHTSTKIGNDPAKPFNAILLGDEGKNASFPLVDAWSAQFTMDDITKNIAGIRAGHLKPVK